MRGFNRAGYGPRDLSTGDALGGQTYWAATAEVRFPLPFVPDDLGVKGALFVDAGSLFGVPANIKALHPALDTWMIVDGYGKVLGRPQLDLARRELCVIAACSRATLNRMKVQTIVKKV